MPAEHLKSTAVTGADATPVDLTGAYISQGRLRESVGIVEAAGGDAGSTYRAVRVFSSWRITDVLLQTDDLGAGLTLDVGLYQIAANGGAVVDADHFASAVDVATAAVARTSILQESAVLNADEVEKRLWEVLGLSEDPKRWYDVTCTSVSAAATGTIAVIVRYVDGT